MMNFISLSVILINAHDIFYISGISATPASITLNHSRNLNINCLFVYARESFRKSGLAVDKIVYLDKMVAAISLSPHFTFVFFASTLNFEVFLAFSFHNKFCFFFQKAVHT